MFQQFLDAGEQSVAARHVLHALCLDMVMEIVYKNSLFFTEKFDASMGP